MSRLSLIIIGVTLGLHGCSTSQYSKPNNSLFQDQKIKNSSRINVQRDEQLCADDTVDKQNCPISFYIDNFKAGDFYINNQANYYLKPEQYNFKVKNCTENSCQSCEVEFNTINEAVNNFTLSVDEKGFPFILENGKKLSCAAPLTEQPLIKKEETITLDLSADTLFKFNGSALTDLKPKGHAEVFDLASKISTGYASVSAIKLVGHTDRLGSESYNQKLGLERANTVRQLLIQKGVSENIITASSAGESQPVTDGCQGVQPKSALTSCLQPDRRVTVEITGITK
ncbi:OmpA family protein [Acinetobacter pittii]|uniref:OmpA family protein n=1 Tax=Acinetobacter pittii TaxID=48296 RepID=UPI002E760217|nr:OmpA family protein [Acinetobacter pittii]WVH57870.1 OmpA family protein [Acinetobacter pittii]